MKITIKALSAMTLAAAIALTPLAGVTASAEKTGWRHDKNGYYYYIEEDGSKASGWTVINDITYYFEKDGRMATGWKTIDGKRYYFGRDGRMRADKSIMIDGKAYTFNKDGSLVEKPAEKWKMDELYADFWTMRALGMKEKTVKAALADIPYYDSGTLGIITYGTDDRDYNYIWIFEDGICTKIGISADETALSDTDIEKDSLSHGFAEVKRIDNDDMLCIYSTDGSNALAIIESNGDSIIVSAGMLSGKSE
ncbi:MAG: hypothetical protein IIU25_00050 [Oscillospiraceae bacterium]|nr:hypothetical protein [Oscillospiraceae bacterium]